MSFPKVVMSPHVMDYNEREFPRPGLCREIIITWAESKKWNTACIAGQIADNQNKDDPCRLGR